jgi:hypothetical protein
VDEVQRHGKRERASGTAKSEKRKAKGFTPLEMLASLLLHYLQTQTPIDPSYLARAREIPNYLNDQRQKQGNPAKV